MSIDLCKQLIFDCAMELQYHSGKMTDKEVADKLISVLSEFDKIT